MIHVKFNASGFEIKDHRENQDNSRLFYLLIKRHCYNSIENILKPIKWKDNMLSIPCGGYIKHMSNDSY